MKMYTVIAILIAVLVLSSSSQAQFYQMSSGSYMTGYGQVHGSFGYAMATQQMYNTVQMNLQKSIARAAMVKKWGEAAVRKAELEAARERSTGTAPKSSASSIKVDPPPPAPKNYGKYRADVTVNMSKTISETLTENPQERAQLKQVIDMVNGVYKEEAAKFGWQNNFAGGMSFFMLMMATVYHDSPDPSDDMTKAVYQAVNESIDGVPDFAKASNKDKHMLNDLLVGLSALPVAVYLEAKEGGNKESLEVAKALAGEMIKMVLKTDPENLKFNESSLTITK